MLKELEGIPVKSKVDVNKRSLVILGLVVFVLYSIVNIMQNPTQISDSVTQSSALSLSKAGSAILLALAIFKAGISFKRLLIIWGVSAFFFISSPIPVLLSSTAFSNLIYYIALGFATSSSLIVITSLLSHLRWNNIKYIIVIQQMIAGSIRYLLGMFGLTDIKATIYFFYVLLAIGIVVLIAYINPDKGYDLASFSQYKPEKPQDSSQLVLIAMAIGGAALAPFLFGLFEQLIRSTPTLAQYQYVIGLVNNLGLPTLIIIVFLFGKPINIDATFFVVSIASFIFLLISLLDPRFVTGLSLASQTLVTFFHLAIWLFIFKSGKTGPIEPAVLIGFSVFLISFSRMCGNLTANASQAILDSSSAVDTLILLALTSFALINLSLFIVTHWLHKKVTKLSDEKTKGNNESSFQIRARVLAEKYSLSQREYQIMLEYAAGRSAPFIADKYYLSVFTVKNYISHIYTKMGVHNRQQLLDFFHNEISNTE